MVPLKGISLQYVSSGTVALFHFFSLRFQFNSRSLSVGRPSAERTSSVHYLSGNVRVITTNSVQITVESRVTVSRGLPLDDDDLKVSDNPSFSPFYRAINWLCFFDSILCLYNYPRFKKSWTVCTLASFMRCRLGKLFRLQYGRPYTSYWRLSNHIPPIILILADRARYLA